MEAIAKPLADYAEREKEVKSFEDSKAGVKGLVDSGLSKIPRFFIQDTSEKHHPKPTRDSIPNLHVPVIDLRGGGGRHDEVVAAVRSAAESWGFFQIVNHGIPGAAMSGLLESVRRFNGLDNSEKMKWYSRDPATGFMYYSNGHLMSSSTAPADWRDTITYPLGEREVDPQLLPQVCRLEIVDYMQRMEVLKKLLSESLSEALGLSSDYLEKKNLMRSKMFVSHYYPLCPEPNLTFGISKHSDPYSLTILLQDNIGGLQVLHQDQWIDVPPLEGALVVNIGDFMQIISNDKLKSVEHRALARPIGPRISAACFFYPSGSDGNAKVEPIKELLSDKKPAIYREVGHSEYLAHWVSTRVDGRSALSHFKL